FNKVERKMCRVVSIDFTGFITVRFPEFEHESDDYNDQMLIEEFEPLMQYTGLKDKNGREIYEGDVLKNDYGELWVVVWEGTGFMLSLNGDSKNIYSANEYYFSSCEVIGNI